MKRKGFTLIELMVVIAIIIILAAIAIPSYLGMQRRAKKALVTSNMACLATGLGTYYTDYGHYPIAPTAEDTSKAVSVSYLALAGNGPNGEIGPYVETKTLESMPNPFNNAGAGIMYVSDADGTHYSLFAYESKTGNITYTGANFDNLKVLAPMGWSDALAFDSNGGTAASASPYYIGWDPPGTEFHSIGIFNYGDVNALPTTTWEGHTFTGWNTAVNGSGTVITVGMNIDYLTRDIGSRYYPEPEANPGEYLDGRVVYAQWTTAGTYAVTFDSRGGSAVSPITDIVYNATVTLPAAPTKTGKTFVGWNTEVGGGGITFTAATPVTDNVVAYAQWTYTVTFDSQGGSVVAPITDIANGATVTLPAAPTKAGNTFNDWNTDEWGWGATFTAATPVTADITVYAQWTTAADTYTVTFDSQGGSVVDPITDIVDGATVTLPTAPTYDGYTFNGWFMATTGGTAFTTATHVTTNLTVYAQWTSGPGGGDEGEAQGIFIYRTDSASKATETPGITTEPTATNLTGSLVP